jgi:copper chaperone NosL
MNRNSKKLLLIAALILVVSYFTPIWEISLQAPQYPEGLGLEIWINTIDGQNPRDLDKVNNLNHYIGMKEIIPEAIPELKIIPYLIGFMILFGLLVAFTGKRVLLYSWTILFILIGVVGMVDFYLWEYDYGHNLNPEAAIKIPGMNYQPPLIGSKQLLNFVATSLPGIGGYAIFLAILLGLIASYLEFKTSKTGKLKHEKTPSVLPGDSARPDAAAKLRAEAKTHSLRA